MAQAFPESDQAHDGGYVRPQGTQVAGELIDMRNKFRDKQHLNEDRRDSYGAYPSQISGQTNNGARIIQFPGGEAKGMKDDK